MRGEGRQQQEIFFDAILADAVRADHPLRPIRAVVEEALRGTAGNLGMICGEAGWPAIAVERRLRA